MLIGVKHDDSMVITSTCGWLTVLAVVVAKMDGIVGEIAVIGDGVCVPREPIIIFYICILFW